MVSWHRKRSWLQNYSLHRKRKSRCWHLHGNAVVCNAKQYNQYMKIIRKLPISGSLYFTCLNCVLQGLDGILSQNQLFVASFWIVAKNNKVCKRRKCLMFIVLIRILIVFFLQRFLTILNRNASNLINRSHSRLVNFSRSLPHITLPRFLSRYVHEKKTTIFKYQCSF